MRQPETTTEEILGHFGSLMRHVAGWHAPEFLGVDVTMSQAKCLYVVAVHPSIGMSALAAHLDVSLSAVSGLVDRLVDHGYVERREDVADRRQMHITLTADGQSVVDHIRELNSEHLRMLLRGLQGDELEALLNGIAALDREARATFQNSSASTQSDTERTSA